MFSGASWWKFDFHMHTPASEGDFREAEISYREFLLSAMEKGLDCLAITDHNTCQWIDALRNELIQMRSEQPSGFKEITIFPGAEIEASSGVHILAIFDPNKSIEEINSVIAIIHNAGDIKKENEAITAIQKAGGIAIPAHVNDTKGLFKKIEGSALKTILDNCDFSSVEVVTADYMLPQLCADNNKEFTYVMGSDCHICDDIAKKYSWVKMEHPTIEALSLALLDGIDGVISDGSTVDDPNQTVNRCYIEELTIQDGQKVGNGSPLSLHFSPWLNTLIGGRGSGKTVIVEFLRTIFDKGENLPSEINETYCKFKQIPQNRNWNAPARDKNRIHCT